MERLRIAPIALIGATLLASPAWGSLQLPPLEDILQNASIRIPGINVEISAQTVRDIVENTEDYFEILKQQVLGRLSEEFCNGGPNCPHDDLLETIIGPLGLPDPEAAEQAAAEILERESAGTTNESGGAFGMNKATHAALRGEDILVASADAFVDASVGEEGQQRSAEEKARVTELVVGSVELAAQAQSEIITQNVMKMLLQQQAQGMAVDGAIYNELLQNRLTTAWNTRVSNDLRKHFLRREQERQFQEARTAADIYSGYAVFSAMLGNGNPSGPGGTPASP